MAVSSSRFATVVSRLSCRNARPTPPARPSRNPRAIFRGTLGLAGTMGIRATSTTRILLDRSPLQGGVFNGRFAQLVSFLFLLLEGRGQQSLALHRRQVFVTNFGQQPLLLGGDRSLRLLQLVLQRCYLRVAGAELGGRLRVLVFELGLLGSQFFQQAIRRHLGKHARVAGLRQLVIGFFLNAVGLRVGQLFVQLIQLGGHDVLLLVNAHDPLFFLIPHQLLLRGLHL